MPEQGDIKEVKTRYYQNKKHTGTGVRKGTSVSRNFAG